MVTKTCCHLVVVVLVVLVVVVVVVVVAVISTALYLTDKGEHNALYKAHNNVYIKTSKIMII